MNLALHATTDTAVLRVFDRGPGINQQLQSEVFERFARGDTSRSSAKGSTGLGLAIVAAVVRAHCGTIAMHSAPGSTTFTVDLPIGWRLSPGARRPDADHHGRRRRFGHGPLSGPLMFAERHLAWPT